MTVFREVRIRPKSTETHSSPIFHRSARAMESGRLTLVWAVLAAAGLARAAGPACGVGLDTPGYTVPSGDVALLYGQSLELLCVMDPAHPSARGYNSSHLAFYRDRELVEPEFLTEVNSTVLRLHMPRPPLSDSMYYCKLRRAPTADPVAVCLNQVTVGTTPSPVEDFRCLSLNWENLTCSWRPPHNFLKTSYKLSFRLRPARSVYYCPDVLLDTDTGNYSCFLDLFTRPHYRQLYPHYNFNLTAENKFGELSQNFTFDHYAHVKPARPVGLRLLNKTSHSAALEWALPYPMQTFPINVEYRLRYRNDVDEAWVVADVGLMRNKTSANVYHLQGLAYAYRHYTARIAIRSESASSEDLWSDEAHVTFHTSGEPPLRPPDTDEGGFEVTATLSHRNVCLYWRQLQVFEENGDNFLYRVEVRMEGIKLAVTPLESKKGYISYHDLPLKALEFFVVSANVEGESADRSRMVVPEQSRVLAEPLSFTKAALGNGTYELTWRPPRVNMSGVESYTIFWCDNARDRPYQCEGRLQWERVSADLTSRNYTVNEDKIYQFAISANGYGTSSGMVWASCTIIPNKAIGKIKDVWITSVDSTFIEIGWKLECPDNVGVIKGYRIFYCPIVGLHNTDCREPVINTTVFRNAQTRANVTNLRPYTTYAIQVSIVAQHEVGPQSDPILSTTREGPPEPPLPPRVSGLSATRMLISWEPPARTNGVLLYYKVFYRADYRDWQYAKVDETKEAYREVLLTNLSSYTNYSVNVVACTVACSVPSETVRVRTAIGHPGAPSRATVRAQDGHHSLRWDPPGLPGGTLDLYEVRVLKVAKDGNTTELYNTTETTLLMPERACQLPGVLTYLYSVRAVNQDAAEDHGAAAFTHPELVTADRRPPGDTSVSTYRGPWSPDAENTCTPAYTGTSYVWIAIGIALGLGAIVGLFAVAKCLWMKIAQMSDIKPVLPEGLDKDSKQPLSIWNPPPKRSKEADKQGGPGPADEVSLLGPPVSSPGPRDTSGFSATTTSTSLSGGSSRRAPSPPWTAPPYSTCAPDVSVSDSETTPTNEDIPYVTYAPEIPSRIPEFTSKGYVQAPMPIPDSIIPKRIVALPEVAERPAVLPPTYVLTALESPVSPYVAAAPPPRPAPESTGYVKHNDSMFAQHPRAGGPPAVPKRTSVPPLLLTKLEGDDKRMSLRTEPYSYSRFGWDQTEDNDPPKDGLSLCETPEESINLSSPRVTNATINIS